MRSVLAILLSFGLWFGTGRHVQAATASGPPLRAVRTVHAPVIDGRLSEPAWATAPADDRFTQTFPDSGKPPSERTTVQVLYDDEALYVGIRAYDSRPDAITTNLARRDADIETDWVAIGIDSRHDHATGFVFLVSAAGVQRDAIAFNDVEVSWDWDAVWESEVSRDREGWSAELKIPLRVLRFTRQDNMTWGLDVARHISRTREEMHWSFVPTGDSALVSRMRHLEGLTGLKPRRAFELRPYVASQTRFDAPRGDGFAAGGQQSSARIGMDLKLGVTSGVTLDATINPDFGQVEADPAVLNLSRFETFFPEKRPFFLEGTDVFSTPMGIFYSRRIGRPPSGLGVGDVIESADGEVHVVSRAPGSLPILGAAKLTGTAGPLTLGVLSALTGEERVSADDGTGMNAGSFTRAPLEHFGVFRLRYAASSSLQFGTLATFVTRVDGDLVRARSNHDAYVQAIDGLWSIADGKLRLRSQLALSERVGGPSREDAFGNACPADRHASDCLPITRPDGTTLGPGDVGVAGKLTGEWNSRSAFGRLDYWSISPRFDANDLGFIQEFNQHFVAGGGGWRDNELHDHAVRRYLGWRGNGRLDSDGVLIGAGTGPEAEILWKSYIYQWLGVMVAPDTWNPYETGDGAYFEQRGYVNVETWLETSDQHALKYSGGAGAAVGWDESWNAWHESTVRWRPAPPLELSLGTHVDWNAGDFRQWFFGGCEDPQGNGCSSESFGRHYRFARLDSGALSFTFRSNWVFLPTLSLSVYSQLFMSRGFFHDRRVVETAGQQPFIYRSDLMPDPSFTGDLDGDGRADDAFRDVSLAVNVVLRWEFAPGSTLIGVYTRGQEGYQEGSGLPGRYTPRGLPDAPTTEVFLVKLAYYL